MLLALYKAYKCDELQKQKKGLFIVVISCSYFMSAVLCLTILLLKSLSVFDTLCLAVGDLGLGLLISQPNSWNSVSRFLELKEVGQLCIAYSSCVQLQLYRVFAIAI